MGISFKVRHSKTVFHPCCPMVSVVSPIVGHVTCNPSCPCFKFSFLCNGGIPGRCSCIIMTNSFVSCIGCSNSGFSSSVFFVPFGLKCYSIWLKIGACERSFHPNFMPWCGSITSPAVSKSIIDICLPDFNLCFLCSFRWAMSSFCGSSGQCFVIRSSFACCNSCFSSGDSSISFCLKSFAVSVSRFSFASSKITSLQFVLVTSNSHPSSVSRNKSISFWYNKT